MMSGMMSDRLALSRIAGIADDAKTPQPVAERLRPGVVYTPQRNHGEKVTHQYGQNPAELLRTAVACPFGAYRSA
jgi:hypothetical protein